MYQVQLCAVCPMQRNRGKAGKVWRKGSRTTAE